MEDYNSKYSGEEVDGLLDEIGNKVDKVEGKQLSTEDFTTILKQKLDGLSNYDDTTISQAVEKLRTDLDALVSGDTTTAIKTFNEVIAFLDGISDTEDLSGIIASIEQQIAGKMDKVTLATVATTGSYNDLADKPTIPSDDSVVHKTGAETISGAKTFNSGVNFLGSGDSNAITLSTNTRINVNGTNKTVLGFGTGTFYINHADYKLLLRGKDTRPTYNSAEMALASDVNGKYSKPSTGIPKTDLASDVQTSLEKADYSVQYTIDGEAVIENGVLVDGQSGVFYALPSADDAAKANADYIVASEAYVDSKVSSGGGGSGSGKEIVEVEPIFEPGGSTGSFMPENPLQPNKVYVFTETISSLSINSIEASNSIVDEYTVMFTAASTNVVISINYKYQVYWANGVTPSVVEGDMCELSLVRIGNDIKAVLTPFKAVE